MTHTVPGIPRTARTHRLERRNTLILRLADRMVDYRGANIDDLQVRRLPECLRVQSDR